MHAPLYSTITLFAELIISGCVYYVIYQGYMHGLFRKWVAWGALAYEIVFNMSYMALRAGAHLSEHADSTALAFAIVHGTLSLIMFISLIVFFILAARGYAQRENYFLRRKKLTILFTAFWTLSILSGVGFYLIEYVLV